MPRKPLEVLTPGVRLGQPVYNAAGTLLLKEGETLTERHLQMLKRWGISAVDVLHPGGTGPEGGGPATELEATLEAVQREMRHRFRRANLDGDPIMAEIFRLAARRCALHRAGGEGQCS